MSKSQKILSFSILIDIFLIIIRVISIMQYRKDKKLKEGMAKFFLHDPEVEKEIRKCPESYLSYLR